MRNKILTLIVLFAIIALIPLIAWSQGKEDNPKVVDWAGGYFLPFLLAEDAPKGIEELSSFNVDYLPNQEDDEKLLMPDEQGHIATAGYLVTKSQIVYNFRKSFLIEGGKQIKLNVVTESVEGVNYSFEGKYLRRELEGTLTKYKDGRKVAQGKIKLYPNVIE